MFVKLIGLALALLFPLKMALGESCAGSTFPEPTCGATCEQAYCQDVSFGQDGSVFQCCISETPKGMIYFLTALFIFVGLFLFARRKARLTPSAKS